MPPSNKRSSDGAKGSFTTAQQPAAKRPRLGLPVDPANLPDGPWKRKLTKVKKELFHQKKVEKQYAKVKARYQRQKEEQKKVAAGDEVYVHPDRQIQAVATVGEQGTSIEDGAVQANEESSAAAVTATSPPPPPSPDVTAEDTVIQKGKHRAAPTGSRQQCGKPAYFQKELAEAEEHKRAAAEREAQAKAREEERARKIAERDRLRKAMAKARKPSAMPGRHGGRVKLGRESGILLDKVKKMVGQQR
ncbi:hypothetical protein PgNI_11491 [Pyricularia grisea]|uniref:rRNA-processing protein FYV7 n=1 Tax=Pyricularia grisea TaxID=148305 RepID=A0A6P8AQ01_PYRGI|nr:hypothetical protein PgNI_11491 [Pyricularia grisea]TLD04107.1 hypothetical protein PgNI_11491 [Pyricularia grisea]